ncbi:MAG: MATE family efflux transporter, partial [Spirochaetales bacterium]|nr:MATE family efflux transporter [Spirochaetales bacterium]
MGAEEKIVKSNGITEGVIWKQILAFFFPILFGTFFQMLYNTVDAVIVGQFLGKQALAAVGGGPGTMINLIFGFFTGLSSGATVIISQFYGAKDDKKLRKSIHTALALALVGGAAISIFGFIFTEP